MNAITVHQLALALADRKGATILTLTVRTQPALKGGKKGPLAGKLVEKVSRVNGVVNWSYQNAVNNQRGREGVDEPFEAEARKWGARIIGTPFVVHTPKDTDEKRVYLEFKHQNSLGHTYLIDGAEVDAAEVEPHLRERTDSTRQGVEKVVVLRDYRVTSITHVTLLGDTYPMGVTADQEAGLYDALVGEAVAA